MKNLIKITTALLLLVQFTGFSQSKTTEVTKSTDNTTVKTEIPTEKFKNFIGTYFLEEGDTLNKAGLKYTIKVNKS